MESLCQPFRNGEPNFITTNSVQAQKYNCSIRGYPNKLFDGILRAKMLFA